jgi:hypothetical protein
MNTKQILRYAFFGALVYGAYKLGEKNAKDDVESEDKLAKGSPEPVEQTEADYIREIIDCIRMKPNKNRKDKDNIELLEIKLKQLLNSK